MKRIVITIKKELRSILRDKKTLVTLLCFPLLIPVMIFLYAYIYDSAGDATKYLVGINYELNTTEVSLMDEVNIESVRYDNVKEMKQAYDRHEIAGYIDYKDDEDKYYVYTNEDSEDGMYVSSYVTSYLKGYNDYLAKLYLIGEDIDVDLAYDNIDYEIVNLEGENFILLMMFTISFTYIIMSIVMATTNMATTATAVEKENGTLETLLTFPVSVKDLIVGKYLAVVIMGILASVIGLVLTLGSLGIAASSFAVFAEINFTFGLGSVLVALLIVILASLFIAGLSMAVVSFAKTYKEAQSFSSMLNMLTIVPMFVSILGIEVSNWYYLIPILNYTQVLMDIFSGTVSLMAVAMVIGSSIIYVVLIIWYILRRYKTERVLF